MKPGNASLEDQVARLPLRERARLALKLIESLDPGQDEDVDELCLQEAERRLAAYDAGELDAVDADEALAEIERRLK
jgi:putative addiction module component (TIGR02574 family)